MGWPSMSFACSIVRTGTSTGSIRKSVFTVLRAAEWNRMLQFSTVAFETEADEHVVLTASGFHIDPVRVLLVSEEDYRLAMKSGSISSNSRAMPILSPESPTVKLTMPFAGKWRIVYQIGDVDSVKVAIVS